MLVFLVVCALVSVAIAYFIVLPSIKQVDGVIAWNLLGTLPIVVLNLFSFFLSKYPNALLLLFNTLSPFFLFLVVVANISYLVLSVRKQEKAYIVACSLLSIATVLYWIVQLTILFVVWQIIFGVIP